METAKPSYDALVKISGMLTDEVARLLKENKQLRPRLEIVALLEGQNGNPGRTQSGFRDLAEQFTESLEAMLGSGECMGAAE